MKNQLLILPALLFIALTSAHGSAVLYEPFDYTPGQALTDANAAWYLNGTTANDTLVVAGNLGIPGLAPSIGNSITHGGIGAAVRIDLPSSVTSGDLYYSFALRIDDVGAAFTSATGFFVSFLGAGPSTYDCRLSARPVDADTYNLGITKYNYTGAGWAPDNFVDGETLFIVARYTFNAGTDDDTADLWIDPDSSTFGAGSAPGSTVSAVTAVTDATELNGFTFRQNTDANTPAVITYDELRIGYTWADVTTPVPEPGVFSLLGLGLLGLLSVRLSRKS